MGNNEDHDIRVYDHMGDTILDIEYEVDTDRKLVHIY